MVRRVSRLVLLAFGVVPVILGAQSSPTTPEPKCEDVYKNIKVFKGVPASDLVPAMEFMAASLKYRCADCHDPKDYAADNRTKETARNMVLMQRDINAKHFNNRNEITCNSCHGGKEHPAGMPIPNGITLRHERMETPPKAEELFAKHIAAAGTVPPALVRTGTLTADNDETGKPQTDALELVQAPDGKFRLTSPSHKVVSNGKQVWYGGFPMTDEPAAIFGRMGRAWRGDQAFAGLERLTVTGKDKIGKDAVICVRGTRPATSSTEELWFDAKTGLLRRLVNVRRSSLGSVLTAFDYGDFKKVGGVTTPMTVVATFAGGEQWAMRFKSASVRDRANDADFVGG